MKCDSRKLTLYEKLPEYEKTVIMLDSILDELAMGTSFFCNGKQLKKPTQIADAMKDGKEIVVEYSCKWCGKPCDNTHRCKEHNVDEMLRMAGSRHSRSF